MSSGLFFDPSMVLAQKALDGLTLRRDVIGQNIANVDTPAYKAQEVNFEGALKRAIGSSGNLAMKTTHPNHEIALRSQGTDMYEVGLVQGGSSRADGNNVDIDRELEQLTETGLTYSALTSVVSQKLALLKSIATR